MSRKMEINGEIGITAFLMSILAVFFILITLFPLDPYSETKEIQCGPRSYHADDLSEVGLGSQIVCTIEFLNPVKENESVNLVFMEEGDYDEFQKFWSDTRANGSSGTSHEFISLHIKNCTEDLSFTYLNQESDDLFLVVYGDGDDLHFRLTLVVDDPSTGHFFRVMAGGLVLICLLMFWAALKFPNLPGKNVGSEAGITSRESKDLEAIEHHLSVLNTPDEIGKLDAIYQLNTIIRMDGTNQIIEKNGVETLINALDSPNKKSFWAILLTIKKIAEAGYVCNVIYDGGAGILALLLKHGKWKIDDDVIRELSEADEWYGTTLLNAVARIRRLTEAQLASNILAEDTHDDAILIEDDEMGSNG